MKYLIVALLFFWITTTIISNIANVILVKNMLGGTDNDHFKEGKNYISE